MTFASSSKFFGLTVVIFDLTMLLVVLLFVIKLSLADIAELKSTTLCPDIVAGGGCIGDSFSSGCAVGSSSFVLILTTFSSSFSNSPRERLTLSIISMHSNSSRKFLSVGSLAEDSRADSNDVCALLDCDFIIMRHAH